MKSQYFEQLNYTLANEDATLERDLLPPDCEHVVAVCGSGGRIIPLLVKSPKRLSIIDISFSQLALCELRIESLRQLSHSDYLDFWGFTTGDQGITPEERKLIFEKFNLSSDAQKYLAQVFEQEKWESILLRGRWERTFVFFSKIAKTILGSRRIERLFQFVNLEEQKKFVKSTFTDFRWNLLLKIVGNARTFNALLYRGSFPENNTGMSYLNYYQAAYQRLFDQDIARRNFFLQLTLLGEIPHTEGFPIEADPEVFAAAKANLANVKIEWIKQDLVSYIAAQKNVGFVSFSNVASYFDGELESNFLQQIRGALSVGAKVVLRNYLHRPENLNRKGFKDQTAQFQEQISKEKVQMYEVEVLERVEG